MKSFGLDSKEPFGSFKDQGRCSKTKCTYPQDSWRDDGKGQRLFDNGITFAMSAMASKRIGLHKLPTNSKLTRRNFQHIENIDVKQNLCGHRSQCAYADLDKVTLSPEITKTRQYATLATSEQIENIDIDEKRRALIAQRVASGFYSQSEIERETADKVVGFPAR